MHWHAVALTRSNTNASKDKKTTKRDGSKAGHPSAARDSPMSRNKSCCFLCGLNWISKVSNRLRYWPLPERGSVILIRAWIQDASQGTKSEIACVRYSGWTKDAHASESHMCKASGHHLIAYTKPQDIAILLSGDHHGVASRPFQHANLSQCQLLACTFVLSKCVASVELFVATGTEPAEGGQRHHGRRFHIIMLFVSFCLLGFSPLLGWALLSSVPLRSASFLFIKYAATDSPYSGCLLVLVSLIARCPSQSSETF